MIEGLPDVLASAVPSAGGAWIAVRLVLAAMRRDIEAAHQKADAAHRRVDEILLRRAVK